MFHFEFVNAPAILDLPDVRARVTRFSVEQYHQLGEYSATGKRTELIRGYVFDKMSKSPLHTSIGSRLYDLLYARLPADCWVRKEEPLTFADSEPEPDISIVRGQPADFYAKHPTSAALVIEVAVTSLAEDRALAALYAEAGVEEYWIVCPRERQVEVYRHAAQSIYAEQTIVPPGATLPCLALPGLIVESNEIFT